MEKQKHYDVNSRELRKGPYYLADGKTQIYFTGKYNEESGFAIIKNQNDLTQGLALCVTKTLKRVE